MMKQKKHRKIPALAAGTTLVAAMTLMASCSTDYEDQIVYNDIEKPFQEDFKKDTVVFEKLPAERAKHILNLSDPSTEIVDKPDYTFQTDNLINVRKSTEDESLVITSWSAKPVSNVTLEMYIRKWMNTFRWRSLNPFPPSPASPSSHHSLADGISGKRKTETS